MQVSIVWSAIVGYDLPHPTVFTVSSYTSHSEFVRSSRIKDKFVK